jgi:hypothetical protein
MTDDQQAVFDRARAILAKFSPPLVVLKDAPGDYQLTTDKPAVVGTRKMDSVWFAGLAATKNGVTLHFLPIYGDPSLGEKLPKDFMKVLKGKACFHVGKLNPELSTSVEEALEVGLQAYRDRGWL